MKHITLVAALVALPWLCAPTFAQDKPAAKPVEKAPAAAAPVKPAEKPAPVPAAKAEEKPVAAAPAEKPAAAPAAKPVEKPAAAKPASDAPRSLAGRDARSCLKLATNRAVAVCAEKYR